MKDEESTAIKMRHATREDSPTILKFIKNLAQFENASDKVLATVDSLNETLFGPKPYAYVVFASFAHPIIYNGKTVEDGVEVGMLLYHYNYSTWEGRPGIWIEDVIVIEEARGRGVGTSLMQCIAAKANKEGCRRVEWMALDWNTPAHDFYKGLGAKDRKDWIPFRLDGEELRHFGSDRFRMKKGFKEVGSRNVEGDMKNLAL